MSITALLVADAAPQDGLGHLSRMSAIAIALQLRGVGTRCHANGASAPLERDGVTWEPWLPGDPLPSDVELVILDSYRVEPRSIVEADVPSVVFNDHDEVGAAASLTVSVSAPPSNGPPRLSGPRYAALRHMYWGLPPKVIEDRMRRILVTTGGGEYGAVGGQIARAVAEELPNVEVTLVRGPYAPAVDVGTLRTIEAPDSLLEQQLAADLVICGGGQTMLETAACATPCIALVLAENQREQAMSLASAGAVLLVDPADAAAALDAVRRLDAAARQDLSTQAQRTIDGYGALRIAFQIVSLLGGHPERETALEARRARI